MTAPPIYLLDGVNKSQPPKSSSLYGVSEDYHRIFDCVCLPHTSRNWCSGPDARGGWYQGRPPLPSLNSLICIQIKHPGEGRAGCRGNDSPRVTGVTQTSDRDAGYQECPRHSDPLPITKPRQPLWVCGLAWTGLYLFKVTLSGL